MGATSRDDSGMGYCILTIDPHAGDHMSVTGSPLASMHSGVVGEVVVGTVDGDPGARPREHIFVGSKASWHQITDSLPQHEAWPPGFAP